MGATSSALQTTPQDRLIYLHSGSIVFVNGKFAPKDRDGGDRVGQGDSPVQNWIQQAQLLDLTSEAICVRDLHSNIVYWNRSAEELYGWKFATVEGKNAHTLLQTRCSHESTLNPTQLDTLLLEKSEWQGELIQLRQDSKQIVVESRQVLIVNEDGQAIAFMEVNRDISQRKQVEMQLAQANERYELAAAALNGLIFDFNCRDRTVERTQGLSRLLGYSLQEAEPTAAWWKNQVHPDDRTSLDKHGMELSTDSSNNHYAKEYRIRHKDGHYRWVQDVGLVLRDPSGQVTRIVGSTTDITERKQLEIERELLLHESQVARAEAEAANQSKDEFLAIVSHELRSPLNSILGWAKLLRTRNLDSDTTNRALEIIQRNAESQAQLIDDLLDVSRMIRGNLRLDLIPVDLLSVLKTALDNWHPVAETKGIQISLSSLPVSASAPVLVSGDAQRLQQIVLNLISNAIKFTPQGGKVDVSLEIYEERSQTPLSAALSQQTSFVTITITDTGKGISAEFLPYVFERFRRASTTTHASEGLGLGLAIVRHLVELHSGKVMVDSEGEGKGTTFTVKLPLLKPEVDYSQVNNRLQSRQEVSPSQVNQEVNLSQVNQEVNLSQVNPSQVNPFKSNAESSINLISSLSSSFLTNVRVLIVDDEPDTREVIGVMLKQEGAIAVTAASAQEARELFRQFKPMILLSDISMPEEDGYGLIQWVRSLSTYEGGSIPAIALTAFARQQDRDYALAVGFHEHLAKPVEPSNLVNTVVRLIQDQNC
jgi:PAS domain S-box-containing protein